MIWMTAIICATIIIIVAIFANLVIYLSKDDD